MNASNSDARTANKCIAKSGADITQHQELFR